MALRGDAKIFFCIVFIACCCTVTFAQTLVDCCLEVSNKQFIKNIVADYHEQISGKGCAIDATILVTRRNKKLCAPSTGPWIQMVKSHVDRLKKDCKKRNYVGQHCLGLVRE